MEKKYLRIILLGVSFFMGGMKVMSQTTPVAQPLTYSQIFSIAATSTVYPTGWQGWVIGTTGSSSFRTTAPTANSGLIASSTATTVTGGVHNYNGKIGILANTTTDPALGLAINTTGLSNLQVNFQAMTIRNPYDGTANTSINGLDLQYRVGSIAGTWTSVSGAANGVYQNNTTTQTTNVTTPQNPLNVSLTLPAACDNQAAVYLRWVMRDVSGTIGALGRPSFAIDNVTICPIAIPTIIISGPTAFCSGQPATYVSTITNGGTIPAYSWKKNGTTVGTAAVVNLSGLIAGDQISCVLTSNLGCATPASVTSNIITIGTVVTPPTISSAIVSNVSCAGIRNGAIDISVSGGTPPYTICWDTTNKTNGPMYAVTIGTKTLTLMPVGIGISFYIDGVESKELFLTRGITYTFNVATGGIHPFHISAGNRGGASDSIVLNGQSGAPISVGTCTFRPNSSHPSLLYYPCAVHQWMGWKVNIADGYCVEDLTNLVAGKYSVSVTDANGCTTSSTYTVTQGNAVVTASLNASSDVTCYGLANGTIDLKPLGGTSPYSSSGTGPTFSVLAGIKNHSHPQFGVGSTNGFIIDGMQGKELTLIRGVKYAFSVLTPGHPFFISTSIVGGAGNLASEVTNGVINSMTTNGTLFFTPNGSHPNLLYYQCGVHDNMGWKINIVNQLPDGDLGNCMAGNYSLTVTDVNGCSCSTPVSVTINQPAAITYYYDGDNDSYGTSSESALGGCVPPPGFTIAGTDCNDANSAVNPGTTEVCNNGIDDNCNLQIDEGCPVPITLYLKLFIEGYYVVGCPSGCEYQVSQMRPCLYSNEQAGTIPGLPFPQGPYAITDCDYIVISAMNTSDGSLVEAQTGLLRTDGSVNVSFNSIQASTSYYIRLTHRNALEVWSSLPVDFSATTAISPYDFTTNVTQAYSINGYAILPLHQMPDGPWAILSGDMGSFSGLGIQDGNIDLYDFNFWDADNAIFNFGYFVGDLNGDVNIDLYDFNYWDLNNAEFQFVQRPF